ncbi:hypothetical protein CHS0354_006666 [Potamilus streckersoni]|uniref:G-protein coupled receptors family 2 profile 2 domain-containing protein n=1 Tax=Potamilus streckersoni TaxID=2493646 RepID=A0AAE0SWV2_9BIVA|nr:hypothetical protein CHS0354_006666 [Potamilus streckersoni]
MIAVYLSILKDLLVFLTESHLINTVILLMVLRIMVRSMTRGSKVTTEERSTIRVGLKAAAILLPILGFTWIFGFMSVTGKETLVFTYLFTFFNSLQGVFFFVFHCLLSIDVQNAYDRRSKRLSQIKATESAFSKSHERRNSDFESSGYSTSKGSLHSVLTDTSTLDRKHHIRNGNDQSPVTGNGYDNLIWTASNGRSEATRKPLVSFDDEVFLEDSRVRHRKNSSDIIRTPVDTYETEPKLNGYVISYNTTPMRKRSDRSSFYAPSFPASINGHGTPDIAHGSDRGPNQEVIYAKIQK